MSPPPDGVNAQSRWPCGTAIRTDSLWSCCSVGHSSLHVSCFCSTLSHCPYSLLDLPDDIAHRSSWTPQRPTLCWFCRGLLTSISGLSYLGPVALLVLPQQSPRVQWRLEIASSTAAAACHFLLDLTSGATLLITGSVETCKVGWV